MENFKDQTTVVLSRVSSQLVFDKDNCCLKIYVNRKQQTAASFQAGEW